MPVVPELLAKKRKQNQKAATERAAAALDKKKKDKDKKAGLFKRAESYVKEYREKEQDTLRVKRVAKQRSRMKAEDDGKLLFVVRVKGTTKMHAKTKKILHLLRLRHINNGVFLRVSKSTMGLLQYIEPFIAYGYPSHKSVKDLVYKRGSARVNRSRVPLTDNKLIEDHLGKHKIICMEDLVHEIFTVGPAFKQATNFLWPFNLSAVPGGASSSSIKDATKRGGLLPSGNQREQINALIAQMN